MGGMCDFRNCGSLWRRGKNSSLQSTSRSPPSSNPRYCDAHELYDAMLHASRTVHAPLYQATRYLLMHKKNLILQQLRVLEEQGVRGFAASSRGSHVVRY